MAKETMGAVILAAGEGTRMKISLAKPLIPLAGRRLVDFPIQEISRFFKEEKIKGDIFVVTGHQKEAVEEYLKEEFTGKISLNFIHQIKQLGTADALKSYFNQDKSAKNREFTLVICADTPMIQKTDLDFLYRELKKYKKDAVAATFNALNPSFYGRIIRGDSDGFHIVEYKDADAKIRQISEVNSGLYIFKTKFILDYLNRVDKNNKAGEFYLTDLFKDDLNVKAVLFNNPETFLGINTLLELDRVEDCFRRRKTKQLLDEGVRFLSFRHTYLQYDVKIGAGSCIHPNVFIEGDSKIGENVVIETGVVIKNCIIEEGAKIFAYSYLESSIVRKNALIGPFARLRPEVDVGSGAKVGNFVEVKKAVLEKEVKVSHLSYVGDAHIGEKSNIGCGFITCNYDGVRKHQTKVGKESFVGSDSQAIAPVTIGDRCYIASGSTINKDMPDDSFAIARSLQVTKKGLAKRFLKAKKSSK
ncbi:MAG: bifunctional UDP-N-acetylglucosamine diphosphorylase/glucosamine-1-phosphate N-acetyltransferase GlmU [Halobacteriovoraceae bacterium]|nr:bifunctional UDP-N-acetylglucosamine diphosphorylase/glucosamine-1-phosphate N-acetyltransferase GlmU [Halobacteriovoraceae bacterium]